ncbi:MAG: YdeI/OmpD-associated family protein [bacterium]
MSQPNPAVDPYFAKDRAWKPEQIKLRALCLASGLVEELKWYHPCYTLDGTNVCLIHAFKDYCAILFHKGVLIDDPENILIQQTENVQAGRQLRFTSLAQIEQMEPTIAAYIDAAIAVEKSGAKVPMKETKDFDMPEELVNRLDADPEFAAAFHALTPGRQKGYILNFSAAKQAKTREARIEKAVPRIMAGKGLDDR